MANAPRTAAFFDLDKTIISKSAMLALGVPFFREGLIDRGVVLRGLYAQAVFRAGGADHDRMEQFREYVSALIDGWDVDQVRDLVAAALPTVIEPLVYAEARALIDQHRQAGHDLVLVSSSGLEIVEPIGQLLGIDRIIATRVHVVDGHYTDQIEFYAYGEHKATAIQELATERGYDLTDSYAYSDSVTDLPLLEAVGRPYAVNPDRPLRQTAVDRGWPVLDFASPSPRRSFGRSRSLVAVGVAGAALTWYAVRRSRATRAGRH